MIQIVEVEQRGLTDIIRHAFCLAAAQRFLREQELLDFLSVLGLVTDDARRISRSVFFSDSFTTTRTVVQLSRERCGVVVVPIGQMDPETKVQLFYAAWLSN